MIRSAREDERLTICQVLHSLVIGGAEVLAAQLARKLCHRFRFVFACLDDLGPLGQQLRDEGFTVEVLGRRPGIDWRCAARLADFVRAEHVDLVHAHQYTPFFQAIFGRHGASHPPVLFTEHGRSYPDYPRRKRILFNRVFLRPNDRVVAVGQAVRQALIDNEGFPPSRVRTIYNGVDLSQYSANTVSKEERAAIRQEMGIAPDELMLIQVARLDPLKDHPTALRTLQRLRKAGEAAKLVIVGDGPERDRLKDETVEAGLKGDVIFLGLRHDIPRLLNAADVCLLTSISEGIPLTVIEAMAADVPIVATDVGGLAEVVVPNETGLLAPAGDDAVLADCISRLANDPEQRQTFVQLGRERAIDTFALERMLDQYDALYTDMLRQMRFPSSQATSGVTEPSFTYAPAPLEGIPSESLS